MIVLIIPLSMSKKVMCFKLGLGLAIPGSAVRRATLRYGTRQQAARSILKKFRSIFSIQKG